MTSRTRSLVAIVAALGVVGIAALLASGDDRPTTLDARAHEIAVDLRCPVCQNLSVADSPSRLAGEMRGEIEAQIRAGRSADEIRAFFVDRYGEWILLAPSRSGLNLLPWLVPVVGLVAGAAVWIALVRRRPTGETEWIPSS